MAMRTLLFKRLGAMMQKMGFDHFKSAVRGG
jgi:hypothetical protein